MALVIKAKAGGRIDIGDGVIIHYKGRSAGRIELRIEAPGQNVEYTHGDGDEVETGPKPAHAMSTRTGHQ